MKKDSSCGRLNEYKLIKECALNIIKQGCVPVGITQSYTLSKLESSLFLSDIGPRPGNDMIRTINMLYIMLLCVLIYSMFRISSYKMV